MPLKRRKRKMNDAQNTVLKELGLILITTQTTEKFLQVVIDFVLPEKGGFNVEDFLKRLNKGDKRTIGVFIGLLQDRVDIVPWFDTLLTDFLKMRNDLIHDVDRIPGYGLTSDEGLLAARVYHKKLVDHNVIIQNTLGGLLRAWQLQNDIVLPGFDITQDLIKNIDRLVVPLIDEIFSQKNDVIN